VNSSVLIEMDDVRLEGDLSLPEGATGVVLFAHGSGSSRFSPRNQFVAEELNKDALATLLIDLVTQDEEALDIRTRELRFDISLLAGRLVAATEWLSSSEDTAALPVGLFGASTGAAAALVAAAEEPELVAAVVSRGGRPDLAGESLRNVSAPTLLIVGSRDEVVVDMNRKAFEELRCQKELQLVEGATHLFEEPGALERVAQLASDWFRGFV
jgi:putative phosphoribosyl transferase